MANPDVRDVIAEVIAACYADPLQNGRRAATRHSRYSNAAKAKRRRVSQLLKECRVVLARLSA